MRPFPPSFTVYHRASYVPLLANFLVRLHADGIDRFRGRRNSREFEAKSCLVGDETQVRPDARYRRQFSGIDGQSRQLSYGEL